MATLAAAPSPQKEPRKLSLEGIVTIAGAVILFLTIVFFNFSLSGEISSVRVELKADIEAVRTELKADIAAVRTELKADIAAVHTELKADIAAVHTELKADIERVEADLQRLDDRIFAIVAPAPPETDTESTAAATAGS